MVRVTHITGGTLTGCTRAVLSICRQHDRATTQPSVVFYSIAPDDPGLLREVAALGIEHRVVVKTRRYDLLSVLRLARAIRSLAPDVVVLHGFGAYSFGSISARIAGTSALIRMEHSPELYTRLHQLASKFTASLVDSTVLVSHHLLDYLRSRGTEPVHPEVIYNGIDLREYLAVHTAPLTADRVPVVFMAARLEPEKEHDTLIRAARLVRDRGYRIRVNLAGSGTEEGRLRRLVGELQLCDTVHFLGHRSDVPACLSEADIGVLATRYEGFGLSLVEAMAAGRPVIGTRVAAVPELMEDGVHGYLVASGSAQELADAITALIVNPNTARQMGEAGRAAAIQRFSVERAVRLLEQHIASVAARKGLRPESDAS